MDTFYIVYFLIHVVITLLIDCTIAVPREWLFPIQNMIGDFHVESNKDFLVLAKPIWLQAFVWVEVFFQTPFFIWAAWDLSHGNTRVYPAVLIYGVEAATTTFGCLAELYFTPGVEDAVRWKLLAVYLPTFLIPLYMTYDFYGRIIASMRRDPIAKKTD